MTDLLLYNGFTPLRRSPADVFLDNGIGMLRASLEAAEINFEIEDKITIDEMTSYNDPNISSPLRSLFKKQIFSSETLSKNDQESLSLLYKKLIMHQEQKVHQYLMRLSDRIAEEEIPIVGMKLWAGSTYNYCKELCDLIQMKSPETLVIAGGPQVNCFTHEGQILKLTPFDAAVYSEGERAIVEIVKTCRNLKTKAQKLRAIENANIPNTIFRSQKDGESNTIIVNPIEVLNINKKSTPLYGDFSGKIPVHTIVDALGCDYAKCSFCVHPQIYPCFRKRTPSLVVDEIEAMIRLGIGLFSFTASDTPLSHGAKISEEIIKRNLTIEFTMLTRAKRNAYTHTDKIISQFRTLIKAGLKSVFFGVESGNDDVLKHVMNKGVVSEDIVVTMDCLRKASELENSWVNIIASFIYPVPLPKVLLDKGISNKTVLEDNLKLIKRIQPDSFHAAPGLLYPGTDWYNNKDHYGIAFDKEDFSSKWISQEFSYHGFVSMNQDFLYSFNDTPLQQLILPSMEFARRGNALGFPSDLWEEQFIFARACNVKGVEKLQQLSEELFLDLLTCNDENTRYLYDAAAKRSKALADSNTHLFF